MLPPPLRFPQALARGNCDEPTDLDGMEAGGVGLLRRRVVPPTGFGGQLPQVLYPDAARVNVEDERSGGMYSEKYFTNLITNGFSAAGQSINIPPHDGIVAHDEGPASANGTQKRTKNLRDEEDILLVSAWLNVSLDAVHGVDQSRATYWKRIHEYFHTHKTFDSDRTQGSLVNRWSSIQHDVNMFAGCLSKIEARNSSGLSVNDKHANACVMFKAEDKQHRNFQYMHCWKILKDQPKWMDRCKQIDTQSTVSKKRKTKADSSPLEATPLLAPGNVDESQLSASALERPVGKKKEKEKLRQRSNIEALDYLLAKKKEADAEKELKREERCKKALHYRKKGSDLRKKNLSSKDNWKKREL